MWIRDRLAGESSTYSLFFTIVSELSAGCIIKIGFPDDFVFDSESVPAKVEGLQSTVEHYDSTAIKSISVTNACTTQKNSGEKFTWEIVNAKNLSLIHICRCRRLLTCRSRWSPYH
eukprot:TRINITY_DN7266_c0_g1_i1.p2 TRINITY_DN7266_c0_g1~~TRINITY_DN7266_c0_g1_i1.p2  ORF type:complete len:126 (+),score=9.57 TRINITY_DN7266_c0_g1_i1:32-379(+)